MGLEVSFSSSDFASRRLQNSASNFETWVSQSRKVSNLPFFTPFCQSLMTVRDLWRRGKGLGPGVWFKTILDVSENQFSDRLLLHPCRAVSPPL